MAGPGGASVVVATVGRAARLARLADAVLADPAAEELIVVVDGPDNESSLVLDRLAATRPRLRPMAGSGQGQLAALDLGVRLARCGVVVLLDDDVIPDPGTIAGHLARHRQASRLVVAGPMPVRVPESAAATAATRLYAIEYLEHLARIETGTVDLLDVLWTGNLSLRRSDCRRVGLASPAFRSHYHADQDLGYRLAAAGLEGVFDPALGACHWHTRSDADFLRDAERQGAGRVALHRAHPERLGPFQLEQVTTDLPRPLQGLVGKVGCSELARPAASGLMAICRPCARAAPKAAWPLLFAKLARRVMQWHGAYRALAEQPDAAAPTRTVVGSPTP